MKELLRIDSVSIDRQNPPGLHLFARDSKKNTFICDRRTPRMYRFSAEGKLLNQFLRKGEGPGEFSRGIYSFKIINKNLWLSHSRKLACFGLNGDFIREWKFNRNITFIEMVDEEKLIGNIYESDLSEQRNRVCALFDRNGEIIQPLFRDKKAGFTEIQLQNNGNIRIIRFFSGLITNDILHTYDPGKGRVFIFRSSEYTIYRKNINGITEMVIRRYFQPVALTDKDRMNIISQVFSDWSSERKKLLKDVLPTAFVAINLIGILPGGHIAVRRITGFRKHVLDIFDSQGQFIYTLKSPPELPGFYRIDISGKMIWVTKELEDRDVFILYEMTNLPV